MLSVFLLSKEAIPCYGYEGERNEKKEKQRGRKIIISNEI
jgi:hypothetical protein